MSRQEIVITPMGEMMDMISCLAIYNGVAKPKKKKLSYAEIIELR